MPVVATTPPGTHVLLSAKATSSATVATAPPGLAAWEARNAEGGVGQYYFTIGIPASATGEINGDVLLEQNIDPSNPDPASHI